MTKKGHCLSYSVEVFFTQIPLPEKPDTEDESELRKWKWKMRSVKKENSERHSRRCDVELKLAVRSFYHCISHTYCSLLTFMTKV